MTLVEVLNTTDGNVALEVEFMDDLNGNSLAVLSETAGPFEFITFVTGIDVSPIPWGRYSLNTEANIPDFDGYALVAADDPRVLAHAKILCKDGFGTGANLVSISDSPAVPVGATLQFFQASNIGQQPGLPLAVLGKAGSEKPEGEEK